MRVVLTCCCGAQVEASWDDGYRRSEPPPHLAKFERSHAACVRARAAAPPPSIVIVPGGRVPIRDLVGLLGPEPEPGGHPYADPRPAA